MRLTKTQKELLMLAGQRGRISIESGHITSRKNGAYGRRKMAAALALKQAGLLSFVTSYHSVHQLSHGFGADVGGSSVWQITEAGKTLLS